MSDDQYLTQTAIPGNKRSGKWAHRGVPQHGWICIGIDDLGAPAAQCEMCEAQTIRYVHQMQHPNYFAVLNCGCVCAGYMEGDLEGARERERGARSVAGRRQRWLSRDWKISNKGNQMIKVDGFRIVVYPVGHQWGFRLTNTATGFAFAAKILLESQDAAKLRSFDAMLWCKEKGK